jgi:hypothetical protein
MTPFIKLNSGQNTPLYIKVSMVLFVEGFTFPAEHQLHANHVGSRITLQAGQWTENIVATEAPEHIYRLLSGETVQDLRSGTTRLNVPAAEVSIGLGNSVSLGVNCNNDLLLEDPFVRVSLGRWNKSRVDELKEYLDRLAIHAVNK